MPLSRFAMSARMQCDWSQLLDLPSLKSAKILPQAESDRNLMIWSEGLELCPVNSRIHRLTLQMLILIDFDALQNLRCSICECNAEWQHTARGVVS